jgi:hypothetical protein
MNIYVSNLSFNTSDAELNELSTPLVKFHLLGKYSRETGRSWFWFVEMPSEDEGKDAMLGLNNKSRRKGNYNVSVAKEEKSALSGGGNRGIQTIAAAVVVFK